MSKVTGIKAKFSSLLSGKDGKPISRKNYYLLYTVVFMLMIMAVFGIYIFTDKSMIYNGDGWEQHYKALLYYSQYLRQVFRNIFVTRTFSIPEFGFSIGEGSDIIETLHYYVIGDPFAFFSVLCPEKYINTYLEFSVFARIYIAGIAFSEFCFYMRKGSRSGVLSGTMVYIFSMWTIFVSVRHPYFLNPMINYPLLVYGLEKIFRKERPYLFIIAVMFTALSNFYFFYMLVLLVVCYVAVRLITAYILNVKCNRSLNQEKVDFVGSIKDIFSWILKIGGYAITGVCMAGVIVAPVLYAFISSPRMGESHKFWLLFNREYYTWLFSAYLTSSTTNWTCLGFASVSLVSMLLLFRKRKENTTAKVLFITCIVFLCFPIFGQVFNGLSYISNRWTFSMSFLVAYIVVLKWEELMTLKRKDFIPIGILTAVCFVLCFIVPESSFDLTMTQVRIFAGFVLATALLTFLARDSRRARAFVAFMFICASIITNSVYKYSPDGFDYASTACNDSDFAEVKENESAVVSQAAKDNDESDLYIKYTGKELQFNANMFSNTTSTTFFWSIAPSHYASYRYRDLWISNGMPQRFLNLNDRAALLETSSIKYYTKPAKNKTSVPYGFKKIEVSTGNEDLDEGYKIYENKYALPVGYCYSSQISLEDWLKLDVIEREETLLQCAVTENYTGDVPEGNPVLTSEKINYTITGDEANTITDGKIYTYKAGTKITLTFEGMPKCETYVVFKNLGVECTTLYDLYFSDEDVDPENRFNQEKWDSLDEKTKDLIKEHNSSHYLATLLTFDIESSLGTQRSFDYFTPDYSYYFGCHDYAINMGYRKDAVTSITITLPERGVYTFDDIDIVCQPMTNYASEAKALQKDVLENIKYGEDCLSGSVSIDSSKILCITIPWASGWSATVDGKEAEILVVNDNYMGLSLDAGNHEIELHYKTPLLREGMALSLAGVAAFAMIIILTEKAKKRKKDTSGK